jgi:hypothetical protein
MLGEEGKGYNQNCEYSNSKMLSSGSLHCVAHVRTDISEERSTSYKSHTA